MQVNEEKRSGSGLISYIWNEWISTFVILILLLLTLVIGTGEMIHGQLLRIGERLYGDPPSGIQYSFLRAEPTKPTCDRHPNIDALVQEQMKQNSGDEFADIFGKASESDVRQSVLAAQQQCEEKYVFYDKAVKYMDDHPSIRPYRTFETTFFGVFKFGVDNKVLILILMVVFSAITASVKMHHIGLRPPTTKIDYSVYSGFMVFGNALLTFSVYKQYESVINSGVTSTFETLAVYWLWMILFAVLTLISLTHLVKPPAPKKEGGSLGLALLSVPLYAYMAILTGLMFIFAMDYPMGQGIYLGQLTEFADIFLKLALFIWAGMLLTQTRVMDLFLGILRPWNLAPETLTWLILIAAAIPTAYTGASGIFVIAAGAIIYKEVWNSGARRQYALAVSAMSGSLGVVIRPCLLVILISMLDSRHVTSDELFNHGIYVFWLTAFVFLGVSLMLADQKFRINSPKVAVPGMIKALIPVIPYVLITIAVIAIYRYGLDTKMDEFTAPVMLPFILLAYVLFDKIFAHKINTQPQPVSALAEEHAKQSAFMREHSANDESNRRGFGGAIRFATAETVGHIGALIILMALSASMAGLIERSELVTMIPTHLGSILITLGFMALLLAIIGMCTDPFGAVILVAGTIAPVAFDNGIHPIHFWMIVLVAFEFGYVTPPVALNHLLTRLSVGDEEVAAADAEAKAKYTKFYYRYERWLLPIMVLFPSLLIVTYAPYFLKLFGWYQ
ncbi:TRAP transporter large permease subunit [Acinetobacter gerneri]|uniref:TRAP transporter large permease subunit n=1 Tax=Acinetobacter gerneri TaxID=202952 RepID=A0AAW8JIQ4_9GAMM|nr:TRAP transporter large permease subunit [Acinetobacter gerneri]MDQ9008392.1 TRAP transporter large permease subunit [Acinetobacter gerneri]MDQ9012643.1 TRAP transporter large permease subunit [Acinetobacter gerneri]MDQ9024078.1 TRAP transporter large permease subunit [Acinetobacter gerneri]MDQ9050960.1 TRAP transporter large permease subunit [Acinetobacter gerneri]MDQ9058538.1 TRAP transporter large permease subunit [Acinetobacter gerneri]